MRLHAQITFPAVGGHQQPATWVFHQRLMPQGLTTGIDAPRAGRMRRSHQHKQCTTPTASNMGDSNAITSLSSKARTEVQKNTTLPTAGCVAAASAIMHGGWVGHGACHRPLLPWHLQLLLLELQVACTRLLLPWLLLLLLLELQVACPAGGLVRLLAPHHHLGGSVRHQTHREHGGAAAAQEEARTGGGEGGQEWRAGSGRAGVRGGRWAGKRATGRPPSKQAR